MRVRFITSRYLALPLFAPVCDAIVMAPMPHNRCTEITLHRVLHPAVLWLKLGASVRLHALQVPPGRPESRFRVYAELAQVVGMYWSAVEHNAIELRVVLRYDDRDKAMYGPLRTWWERT